MYIVKMLFGSHLYGTQTPQSDTDYKGVFMPTKEQVYLGKIPKQLHFDTKQDGDQQNTKDDVDFEVFSLHQFIKLALQGQTVAIDMLHAPDACLQITSSVWNRIIANREKFYTKDMSAFIGYAQKQAAKYGIKGSRLAAIQSVIDFLEQMPETLRLAEVWSVLTEGEHIFRDPASDVQPHYSVAGTKFPPGAKAGYVVAILQKKYDAYGARAVLAKENKGIDWKAISHALRAAYQLRSLYTYGTIQFPLPEAEYLLAIKQGELDYTTVVEPQLEELIDEVKELAAASEFPDKPDKEFWDQFIMEVLDENI